ncbi:MAG TPA: uroporphyrinogen-III C-methyltransferase [Abditibacteriaceae bacterium]|jgi:uroporphyrinogen III methyltransferase/synthase
MNGIVYLVGAGPGDPGLLTCRGREILQRAEVVVYDRLIGAELLDLCRADAERIFVGKAAAQHAMQQEDINELLAVRALEGKTVCRLKGGDPFVFGRGGEEALHCLARGVRFEVVPGVSSGIAAPAYAGIPVTHREVATSFAVVTGHTKDDDSPPENLPEADTLLFFMGVRALPKIVRALRQKGRAADTPVALVRWGTTAQQEVVVGTLETIEAEVARAGLKPPALIVVGEVVRLRDQLRWFDNRPLWGQTVVVTRAREQASSLVEELRSRGASVVQCPSIQVEKLEDYTVADTVISELVAFDWIVFTSTNGVAHFWQRLEAQSKDARVFAANKIAAIGPATVDALKQRGIMPDFVPEESISERVGEGLLERGAKRVLILRAEEGREALEKTLRDGGCETSLVPVYRTRPDTSEAPRVQELLARGEIDWVTFSSSSTVRNFLEAVGEEVVKAARDSFRVAVIGPVTAQTARECGLEPDVIAAQASVESLAAALESDVGS